MIPADMPPHPVALAGEWPCVLLDREALRAWWRFDGEWELEILSTLPDVDHNVPNEISQMGSDYLLEARWGDDFGRSGRLERALALGLVAGQPFYAEVCCHYYEGHTQDGKEWDCDVDFEVLERKSLSSGYAARMIHEWLVENCGGAVNLGGLK